MATRFDNKIILITGGTGSWGHELVRQLLLKYPSVAEIRIYSRGEHRQVEMIQEFQNHPKLRFIIGDIRDKNILNFAMQGVNIVFHLAALKHVPICENNSWEAVLTNIYGSQNIIESAISNHVDLVIDVSTDKAVEPFNLYGITKAAGEKLMVNANFNYVSTGSIQTKFICVRGGNVIGTNGSVIPLFKKQLKETNQITVTNTEMTRYLMSTKEAISLLFTAVEQCVGGELFVMNMPATSIRTIANVMIKLFGNNQSKIIIVGTRPGEKTHEVLISKNEASSTHILSDSYFVILPQLNTLKLKSAYERYPSFDKEDFSSENARQLSKSELISILKNEGWLWK